MSPEEAWMAQQALYSPMGIQTNPLVAPQAISKVAETNAVPGDPEADVYQDQAATVQKKSLMVPLAIGAAALLALRFLK
jgi:hypothetical protein